MSSMSHKRDHIANDNHKPAADLSQAQSIRTSYVKMMTIDECNDDALTQADDCFTNRAL